ncbi:hypothetical protein [Actinomycetospora flava]|uniref:Anti-sigma factor NepR domain-containing protein n=1 Tax=Actinomycetospora flava TaxID=3129232 RepID=A0ABU8M8E8_9PSEU
MYVVHVDDEVSAALEQLPAEVSAMVLELRAALEKRHTRSNRAVPAGAPP